MLKAKCLKTLATTSHTKMSTDTSVSSGGGSRLGGILDQNVSIAHERSYRAFRLDCPGAHPRGSGWECLIELDSNSSNGVHTRVDTIIADEGSVNRAQSVSACLTAIAQSASGSEPRTD